MLYFVCRRLSWIAAILLVGVRLDAQEIRFALDVRPILSDRCFVCHGPDESQRASGIRLDTAAGLSEVVRPFEPDSSELLRRMESADPDEQMPPPHSNLTLSENDLKTVRNWIHQGAKWEQHWSFTPITATAPPKPLDQAKVQNPIDAFVQMRLEQGAMTLSPTASREKLMRRVSLDLTGLAPTLEELDGFLNDHSAEAYEKLVDRLLASPRFGERLATWWLDLARYSDTYGYQVDRERFVWPWRDWVVKSFNSNLPYNQFAIHQLAGDLLDDPTEDQILATTFNRLHPQKVEGGSIEEEFRVEYVADRVHTFGTAFLGLTVECARCHDHKFDPLSMNEYYQLFAFFNGIDEAGLYSFFDAEAIPTPSHPLLTAAQQQELAELKARCALADQALKKELAQRDEALFGSQTKFNHTNLEISASCRDWLNDPTARSAVAEIEKVRLKRKFDIDWNSIGGNEVIELEDGAKEVRLTGDDEIKVNGGKFSRDQPFSVSTTLQLPSTEDGQPIDRAVVFHCSRAWTDSASRGYQLLIEDGKLSAALIHFWPGNAICIRTVDPLAAGAWHNVVMTYDGSSSASGLRIYLNGVLQNVEVVRDNLSRTILGNGTDQLILGARFRDHGFQNGKLSSFQYFDTELTSLEVVQLHDQDSLLELLERDAISFTPKEKLRLAEYFYARHEPHIKDLRISLQSARQALSEFQNGLPAIMVMRETPGLRKTFTLLRGSYDSPDREVAPETPGILPPLELAAGRVPNRLDLANWLVDDRHPLTARVAVNQLWQLMFGAGLVRTPEDFGNQSAPPTYLALLDWLAADFQRDWDIKRCLKQMVMSATYQQSSFNLTSLQQDPENNLFGRAGTFRLSAEMLRDNGLRQSGLLVEQIGGPPVRPYDLALAFSPLTADQGDGLYRRSLYTYWKRTSTSPAMIVLDAPTRDVCTVNRERTSSPLQALLLLNGTQFVESARKLSEAMLRKHETDRSAIAHDMFRSLTSRAPSEQEQTILLELFARQLERYSRTPALAQELIGIGDAKSDVADLVELAAWTTVAGTLMNFEETIFRN